MITRLEFEQAAKNARQELSIALPKMIGYKKSIQVEVLETATPQELSDVVACRLNQGLVEKLTSLAHDMWMNDRTPLSLYCASMAVATIIKEYEWGLYYLTADGLYEIATRIQNN